MKIPQGFILNLVPAVYSKINLENIDYIAYSKLFNLVSDALFFKSKQCPFIRGKYSLYCAH